MTQTIIYGAISASSIIALWKLKPINIGWPQVAFIIMSATICSIMYSFTDIIPTGEKVVVVILSILITLLFTLLGIVAHNEHNKPES